MSKITFLAGPKVKLNYTADDWQLYGIPGRETAASELNQKIADRIAEAPTLKEFNTLDILGEHARYGAADSEGYWILENILEKVYGGSAQGVL